MKNISYIIVAVVVVMMTACQPDVEIPKADEEAGYAKVYMPQAEGGVRKYTLDISSEPETFFFGVAFGGTGYPSSDIEATIAVNRNLVESYNTEHRTSYPVLSEDIYSVSDSNVVLSAGDLSSSVIKITINTEAMIPFTDFLLPVQVESINDSSVPLNEDLKTAYYLIRTEPNLENYEHFDRSNWTVVDYSTEEPAEGANGGLVTSALDGNDQTFWHSKWSGGIAPGPHWFIIDMGETHVLHGFQFLGRQSDNDGKPRDVMVEISTDGTTWTIAGKMELENTWSLQNRFLIDGFNQEARYFKLTVKNSYGGVEYTHLAELNAF